MYKNKQSAWPLGCHCIIVALVNGTEVSEVQYMWYVVINTTAYYELIDLTSMEGDWLEMRWRSVNRISHVTWLTEHHDAYLPTTLGSTQLDWDWVSQAKNWRQSRGHYETRDDLWSFFLKACYTIFSSLSGIVCDSLTKVCSFYWETGTVNVSQSATSQAYWFMLDGPVRRSGIWRKDTTTIYSWKLHWHIFPASSLFFATAKVSSHQRSDTSYAGEG
jgi:hypothetical protein